MNFTPKTTGAPPLAPNNQCAEPFSGGGARMVRLVDDEDVGDLHDTCLESLHIVAHARNQHNQRDGGYCCYGHFRLADSYGFDDYDPEAKKLEEIKKSKVPFDGPAEPYVLSKEEPPPNGSRLAFPIVDTNEADFDGRWAKRLEHLSDGGPGQKLRTCSRFVESRSVMRIGSAPCLSSTSSTDSARALQDRADRRPGLDRRASGRRAGEGNCGALRRPTSPR